MPAHLDDTLRPHAISASTRAWPSLHAWLWRWAPKHPLQMTAVFDHCWLINYRMPLDVLAARLPAGIEPDPHDGSAWLSIVIAAMSDMRPSLAPSVCAVTFDQVVYRAVVRHQGQPGVFFLRTDANHRLYAWAGDLLTYFHFHYNPIHVAHDEVGATLSVRASGADVDARFDHQEDPQKLSGSAFPTVEAARPFLVDRYHAFNVHPRSGAVGRVTVDRTPWDVRAVRVSAQAPFMEAALPGSAVDSAFYAPAIPYVWSRLRPPLAEGDPRR